VVEKVENMEFGLQFFPDVSPDEKSAQQYWNESL